MARFVKLPTTNGKPLFVNPDAVVWVKDAYGSFDTAEIAIRDYQGGGGLSSRDKFFVKATPEEVARLLEDPILQARESGRTHGGPL